MRFAIKSDVGKKRTVNEDRAEVFVHSDQVALAVLADGMGGHNAGDVASSMLVQHLIDSFKIVVNDPEFSSKEYRKEWLHETVLQINKELFEYSNRNEGCKGMGTTMEAALIYGSHCIICHVGDSRVYLIAKDSIKQLTKDHSYVNVLVESGEISEEQAVNHPQKNLILKAIGSEKSIAPDFVDITLDQDMTILLCSDGLSNKLSGDLLLSIIINNNDFDRAGDQLIQMANDLGGEDNISLILLSELAGEV